jgi:hypothetical protein
MFATAILESIYSDAPDLNTGPNAVALGYVRGGCMPLRNGPPCRDRRPSHLSGPGLHQLTETGDSVA